MSLRRFRLRACSILAGIMPKVKHKVKVLAGVIIVICIFGLSLYVSWTESLRINATETILNAIGTRNLSSSMLVLPNKSTTLLHPDKSCEEGGRYIFALFIVISSPENRVRRDAIRKGWSSAVNDDMPLNEGFNKVIFFTGVRNDGGISSVLEEEWRQEGDLIVEDLADTYLNLTLKVLRAFKWQQKYCTLAKYLVKIDDDVHLHMPKFMNHLRTYSDNESQNLVGGHLYNTTDAIRDPSSKWFVPENVYSPPKFPKFISGVCYILGIESVPKIYRASLSLPLFHLEDVFLTGMIAADVLKMKLTHIPSMSIYWTPISNLFVSSCYFSDTYISVHSVSSENLQCWNQFNSKTFVCDMWPIYFHC